VHCGIPFVGFLGSTRTTQCKSLFKEYISLDDMDSKTATIGIGHLDRFCNRVTEVTLNFKSVSALNTDSSEIETGRFLIIIESGFSEGNW
jgi:hypothetical protein